MTQPILTALERRKIIQENAKRIGIDDTFISNLVETFYGRIRSHDQLGPIFEEVIGRNWDTHLMKMKSFWASVAMNAGTYSGQPIPVHRNLTNVNEFHFDMWLLLFEETLKDIAKHEDVIPYFMDRAKRIAESLKLAMFGVPELKFEKV